MRMILWLSIASILATSQAAIAQSDCAAFAEMLGERRSAVSKAAGSLDKLRPGPPDFCTLAKEFVETTALLQKFIQQN